ncbi:hypothetical protein OH779_40305 [Actinacidiphila glaucinigra]|uniref:hypothetical protein n=1 Tax=Actinacidiphila glaucinigra TaxID=235986 RepID=UPI0038639A61
MHRVPLLPRRIGDIARAALVLKRNLEMITVKKTSLTAGAIADPDGNGNGNGNGATVVTWSRSISFSGGGGEVRRRPGTPASC